MRRGKGGKDRMVPLPQNLKQPLADHLLKVQKLHQDDLRKGLGKVDLPHALERKYPEASAGLAWQFTP